MKRTVKNLILFGVMLVALGMVALGMVALTVLHGYGITGARRDGNGAAVGMPGGGQMSQRPDGDGNRGDGGDGEVIGEITLPEAENQGNNPNGGQNFPQAPDGNGQGNGQTPPQMPGGGFDGMQPGNLPNAGGAGSGSLGAHLAFASAWIFVFAFCLVWAILSRCNRGKEKESWQQAPVSNGTN